MLDVYFAIAANRVLVDARTNQVSIIDVYEKLESPQFPVFLPKVTLLFYLSRDAGDPQTRDLTMICSLEDVEIFNTQIHVDFQVSLTNRIVLEVEGVTIPKPGTIKARIMDKDQSLGVLDLLVERRAA
jgi:hypothetical protein